MNKLTMFLTRPLKGNDGGASLLKTYTGQNTGPIGRPEFLAITLTIWVLNFILHVGDGPQLCMDLYVFGMFTLLSWMLFLRPETHRPVGMLSVTVVLVFVGIALGANLVYVGLQPQPTDPIYYHLAAISSLDGPALAFVAFLLTFRVRTKRMALITGIAMLLTLVLSTNAVSLRVIHYPEWIYAFGSAKLLVSLVTFVFVSALACRLVSIFLTSRQAKAASGAA